MGMLPMDPDTIARVKALAARAERRENWYRPGEAAVPGDSPTFREMVGTYKVVFTWTVDPDRKVYRHMTISSLNGRGLPRPLVVFTIAHWLGFTGAEPARADGLVLAGNPAWYTNYIDADRCFVVGERIEGVTA